MSSSESLSEEEEEFRDDMRVFLRLRPINKLEQSRRSKNCIELHEDPTLVTVDSPLEGEYDYTFDHIFEEYATQEEVYEQAVVDIPHSMVEGYSCTIIAYGQTGTGKTHTMMGNSGGNDGLKSIVSRVSSHQLNQSSKSIGAGAGADNSDSEQFAKSENPNLAMIDPENEGMIPRAISRIFEALKAVPATTEITIRCSYVEIYLEKILDLLNPHGTTSSITIQEDDDPDRAAGVETVAPNVLIQGAAELCCVDESDVIALLARGNASRTMSSTEMNTDSSRSHAIFVLRLEQRDRLTNKYKVSTLYMADLAGSELGAKDANKRKSMAASIASNLSAVQSEAMMINKSLNALNKMVRATVAVQQGEQGVPLDTIARQSKLTQLLRPAFGGNCLTTLILTASPSSYNIGETISTINFGQRCRRIYNDPLVVQEDASKVYKKQLNEKASNYENAMALVKALAGECVKTSEGESSVSGPLWDIIRDLASRSGEPVDFKVTIRKPKNAAVDVEEKEDVHYVTQFGDAERVRLEDEIEALKEENEFLNRQRMEVEGNRAELQSEVAVLRTQNENLLSEKKKNVEELMNAKNELQVLSQRKLEVEHNLRTSQFRENEAIVFLRQFRRFYRNVLKDKAAHGGGSIGAITHEVTHKVPNAPDLTQLRDVDCLLLESGLLEEYELGEDRSSGTYLPTKEALMRSAGAANRAAGVESEVRAQSGANADDDDDDDSTGPYVAQTITRMAGPLRLPGPGSQMDTIDESHVSDDEDFAIDDDAAPAEYVPTGADAGAGSAPRDDQSVLSDAQTLDSAAHSIARMPTTGATVARKHRLLRTPAGKLTAQREKDLERELLDMSEKCIGLQMALNEEKAVVDALTNKSGGLSKKRLAQEAITLRQQVEKKTASLTAIAWKMNELNLVNKTYNEKMANREQHVLYLEEQLVDLQNNNRRHIVDREEHEKKMREEISNLQAVADAYKIPLWQFGETSISEKPLPSRIIVTTRGGDNPYELGEPKRRRSIKFQEEDMEFPDIPDNGLYESTSSVDDNTIGSDDQSIDIEEISPKRPQRKIVQKLRLTVKKVQAIRALNRSSIENFGDSDLAKVCESVATQTDDIAGGVLVSSNRQDAPVSRGVGASLDGTSAAALAPAVATIHKVETDDTCVQTDDVQVFNPDVSMIPEPEPPELNDSEVQTEDVQVFDADIAMIEDVEIPRENVETQTEEAEQTEKVESGAQTDDVQIFDIEAPMVVHANIPTADAGMQTKKEIPKQEAAIQTEKMVFAEGDQTPMRTHERDIEKDTNLDEEIIEASSAGGVTAAAAFAAQNVFDGLMNDGFLSSTENDTSERGVDSYARGSGDNKVAISSDDRSEGSLRSDESDNKEDSVADARGAHGNAFDGSKIEESNDGSDYSRSDEIGESTSSSDSGDHNDQLLNNNVFPPFDNDATQPSGVSGNKLFDDNLFVQAMQDQEDDGSEYSGASRNVNDDGSPLFENDASQISAVSGNELFDDRFTQQEQKDRSDQSDDQSDDQSYQSKDQSDASGNGNDGFPPSENDASQHSAVSGNKLFNDRFTQQEQNDRSDPSDDRSDDHSYQSKGQSDVSENDNDGFPPSENDASQHSTVSDNKMFYDHMFTEGEQDNGSDQSGVSRNNNEDLFPPFEIHGSQHSAVSGSELFGDSKFTQEKRNDDGSGQSDASGNDDLFDDNMFPPVDEIQKAESEELNLAWGTRRSEGAGFDGFDESNGGESHSDETRVASTASKGDDHSHEMQEESAPEEDSAASEEDSDSSGKDIDSLEDGPAASEGRALNFLSDDAIEFGEFGTNQSHLDDAGQTEQIAQVIQDHGDAITSAGFGASEAELVAKGQGVAVRESKSSTPETPMNTQEGSESESSASRESRSPTADRGVSSDDMEDNVEMDEISKANNLVAQSPRPGVSRFMLDDSDVLSPNKRSYLDDTTAVSSRRPANRNLMLDLEDDQSEHSVRHLSRDSSIRVTDIENNVDVYDDLGSRWGMSEEEMAADTAVLTNRRESLLGKDESEGDASTEPKLLESMASLKQPDEVPTPQFESNRSFASDMGSPFFNDSDKPKLKDRGVGGELHPVESNDDFEIMMSETAAVLRAADELIGAEKEEEVSHKDDSGSDSGEPDFDMEKSDDDGHYVSEESDDDLEGSARMYRSALYSDGAESAEQITGVDTAKLLEAGRGPEYKIVRFALKLGRTIKGGVAKEGRQTHMDTSDDGSLVSASTMNNKELSSRDAGGSVHSENLTDTTSKLQRHLDSSISSIKSPHSDKEKKKKKKRDVSRSNHSRERTSRGKSSNHREKFSASDLGGGSSHQRDVSSSNHSRERKSKESSHRKSSRRHRDESGGRRERSSSRREIRKSSSRRVSKEEGKDELVRESSSRRKKSRSDRESDGESLRKKKSSRGEDEKKRKKKTSSSSGKSRSRSQRAEGE